MARFFMLLLLLLLLLLLSFYTQVSFSAAIETGASFYTPRSHHVPQAPSVVREEVVPTYQNRTPVTKLERLTILHCLARYLENYDMNWKCRARRSINHIRARLAGERSAMMEELSLYLYATASSHPLTLQQEQRRFYLVLQGLLVQELGEQEGRSVPVSEPPPAYSTVFEESVRMETELT